MSQAFRQPPLLALPFIALLLAWGAALAQPAPSAGSSATAAPPGKGEQQALQLFRMLDADGDGRISRAEAALAIRIKPSLAELFRDADNNGDGYLTQGEIRAAAERKRAERLAGRQAEAGRPDVSGR